jgi:hypothetical protein
MAETLDEAAALAVSALRKADWNDVVGTGTKLEVQVRDQPPRNGDRAADSAVM